MDYRTIIESSYNRQNWQQLLHDIFGKKIRFWEIPQSVQVDASVAKNAFHLGNVTLPDGYTIAIYEVELSDTVQIQRNRVGIRNLLCSSWKGIGCVGAFMFCFRQHESVLRFSYVSESLSFANDGSVTKESTDTKRFTYLLGEGHRSRTAIEQFEKLRDSDQTLKDITKAFSVEALSELFFKEYKKQYEDIVEYITGKRMLKVANRWEEKETKAPCAEMMQGFSSFPNPEKSVRDYVKKLMGRLVFIQFLQKKGWMGCPAGETWQGGDREFLQNLFAATPYKDTFVDDVLEPLFNDLNTKRWGDLTSNPHVGKGIKIPYLNGGLFEMDDYDKVRFPLPGEYMKDMLDFFASYNFTIDENDPDDAEIGVDPEMMGRIFENLLEDNKDKGAFYTPKEIVQYMCRESLVAYLTTCVIRKQGEEHKPEEQIRESVRQLLSEPETIIPRMTKEQRTDFDGYIRTIKICDPAIGSGAFPMGMLGELVRCRECLGAWAKNEFGEMLSGDYAALKAEIIQNNIYGVDIEHGAIDIARLRFWLSIIVDEKVPHALPNFDYKFMRGNSLIPTFAGEYINLDTRGQKHANVRKMIEVKKKILDLKRQFYTASGDRKHQINIRIKDHILHLISLQLGYEIESWAQSHNTTGSLFPEDAKFSMKDAIEQLPEERRRIVKIGENLRAALRDEAVSEETRSQLDIQFFDWRMMFTEVFDTQDGNGGFDIVIGNPPYVQLQVNNGTLAEQYQNGGFETFARTGDIYCLFYELGHRLLSNGGHLCFITSNKWMRAGYGEKTREFFANKTNPKLLIDFAGVKIFENATVDVNILLYAKEENQHNTRCAVSSKQYADCVKHLSDFVRQQSTFSDFSSSESWVILSPIEQSIKRKIESVGKPLKDWDIQIYRGVLTGCNEAFIISTEKRNEILDNCADEDERKRTEALIRPILRGRDIKRYGYDWDDKWLINTHNGLRGKIPRIDIEDYPAIKSHLDKFWDKISIRADKGDTPYNLRNCAYLDLFYQPHICWKAVGKNLAFALVESGIFLTAPASFISAGESNDYILTYLRSNVGKYYIYKNSDTTGAGDIMLNIQSLIKFPIPPKKIQASINEVDIYQSYGFSMQEIEYIEKSI